jgi:hypothetical protein
MATATVFANGLSIACKSVDGKSVVAFPDPCWTNPGPSAGPIVLPFANTAYAKDTANASKTVFIGGKPIMLKDKSYFKTSEGNEAAAYGKGFFTGVKKGKAYFASWSMNVKVEGFNVCRHTDLMTHNHASQPSNTATWYYTDRPDGKPPKECAKDCERIEEACGKGVSKCEAKEMCGSGSCPDKKAKKKAAETKRKKGNAISMFKKKFGSKLKDFRNWKQEHCRGALLINSCGFDKAGDMMDQLNQQVEDLTNFKDSIPKMFEEFVDGLGAESLSKWADEMVGALVGKGAEKIAYKKVPILGQIDMIYDGVQGIGNLSDFRKTLETTLPQLSNGLADLGNQVQESIDVLKSDVNMLERIKNGEIDKDEFLEIQKKQAQRNPCVSARKCNLQPYGKDRSLAKEEGCCPGQTPHHMIPNSMMQIPESEAGGGSSALRNTKDSSGQANCPEYTHGSAPTVCAEGRSQNECTHKEVHDESANLFDLSNEANNLSLDQVISDSAKAHEKTFKRSGCSKSKKNPKKTGCIEAQLRDYFKKKCNDNLDFKVRPVNGKGQNL